METEYKGYKIEIERDPFADDPRNWDNLGKMICFHNNYKLGDNHDYKKEDFDSWAELGKQLEKDGAKVILPVYMYDHSGITISTAPFSCPWDSGQIGFIVAFKKDIEENYGIKSPISKDILSGVAEVLRNEIETYDRYLRGDVYYAKISEAKKCETCGHIEYEEIDSMGNIFEDYEDVLADAKSQVERLIK